VTQEEQTVLTIEGSCCQTRSLGVRADDALVDHVLITDAPSVTRPQTHLVRVKP